MPKLSHFSMLYPDIGIRLNASTNAIDLTAETADFDVRYGPVSPEPGVIIVPFPKEPLEVMCAPSLANGSKPIRSPKDLQHPTIIQSEVHMITRRDWAKQPHFDDSNMQSGPRLNQCFMPNNH